MSVPNISHLTNPHVFFFNAPAATEIYTLSLHDALPICRTKLAAALRRLRHVNAATDPLLIARTLDRKSTRLNSSHVAISYAVFCLKKKMSETTRANTSTSTSSIHRSVPTQLSLSPSKRY